MKITLIHWRPEEAEDRLRALRELGHEAELLHLVPGSLKELRAANPDVYVIDLSRLPSHGAEIATALRQWKTTRSIPIVFAGGLPEKIEKVRTRIPDAIFGDWPEIARALLSASKKPAGPVIVPPRLSGYEPATVAKKLGITPGSIVTVLGAPDEYPECLCIPDDVEVYRRAGQASDRVLAFIEREMQLPSRFSAALKSVSAKGNIWLIWPKKSSGVRTDVSEQRLREFGIEHGWVDYKVCAVDKTWSGLLFGRRRNQKE